MSRLIASATLMNPQNVAIAENFLDNRKRERGHYYDLSYPSYSSSVVLVKMVAKMVVFRRVEVRLCRYQEFSYPCSRTGMDIFLCPSITSLIQLRLTCEPLQFHLFHCTTVTTAVPVTVRCYSFIWSLFNPQ